MCGTTLWFSGEILHFSTTNANISDYIHHSFIALKKTLQPRKSLKSLSSFKSRNQFRSKNPDKFDTHIIRQTIDFPSVFFSHLYTICYIPPKSVLKEPFLPQKIHFLASAAKIQYYNWISQLSYRDADLSLTNFDSTKQG